MGTFKKFNTTTEQWEHAQTVLGINTFTYSDTPTGSGVTYTTSQPYVAGTLEVYVNGLKQANGTHVTESNPGTGEFTLDAELVSGDVIRADYQTSSSTTGNAQSLNGRTTSADGSPGTIPIVSPDGDIYSNGEKVLTGGAANSYVATTESISSGSYVVAPTPDSVTVEIKSSGIALVCIGGLLNVQTASAIGFMSFSASGANSFAASDANYFVYQAPTTNRNHAGSRVILLTGLAAGSTTFTAEYKVSSGSMNITHRTISAVPL